MIKDQSTIVENSNTGIGYDGLDTAMPTEGKNQEQDKRLLQQLSNFESSGIGIFAFLLSFFFGLDDEQGLGSDSALSKMASALSIPEDTFRNTIDSYRAGDLSIFQAAKQTRSQMDISRTDMARAEQVVAQYAQSGNPLLELIADKESGGDYNRVYGKGVQREDLTNMTINDVIAWQRNYTQNEGSPSSAAGKYQIIRKTLTGLKDEMALTGNEPFDENMQDRMAMHLLDRRGYDDYLAGDLPEDTFMENIAKEWASMPKNESGLSYYAGDGLNKAHAAPATLLLAMRHTKTEALQPTTVLAAAFGNGEGVETNDPQQPNPLTGTFDGQGVDQVALTAARDATQQPADITIASAPAAAS
ncbi:MAG: hypothetical protein ACRBCK_08030 [Alphaproteobacteria bacterium]